jgi:hypothetical protein
MGISLNHLTEGAVSWFPSVDGNWSTLESKYVARQTSDTGVVSVGPNVTAETVLMNNTTIPANALGVGTVIRCWASGTASVPASTTVTITFTLRWGGLGGTILTAPAWSYTTGASVVQQGWNADVRLIGVTTGASGSLELERYHNIGGSTSRGVSTLTIDTTTAKALVWTVSFSASTGTVVSQRQMVTDLG